MGNPLQDSVRSRPVPSPLVDGDFDPSGDSTADVVPLRESARTPRNAFAADMAEAAAYRREHAIDPAKQKDPDVQKEQDFRSAIGDWASGPATGTADLAQLSSPGSDVRRANAMHDPSLTTAQRAQVSMGQPAPAGGGIPGAASYPPPPPEQANGTPIITHPGASAQAAAEGAPPAQPVDPLDRMFADALKGGGGGGAGGKRFDPYAFRTAAYERALAEAEDVRRLRAGATRLAAGQSSEEANAMDRYAQRATARGESQAKEARGREGAFVKEAEAVAGEKINPNHYKETRSTVQAGLDFLGNVFGGLAAGARGGGPNRGLENLHAKIAADIQAQKDNHEIKVEGVKAKQTAYGMMLDRFHNDQVADHMAQADELQKWRALGDARAALEKNVEAEDDWAKTRAAIDERIASNKDQAAIAARQGGPDVLARLKKYYELKKMGADIEHTNAETAKLHGEVAKGPPLTEEQKAQREVDANLASIDKAKNEVGTITRGTAAGAFAAEHLPRAVPGVEGAQNAVNDRETYNNRVRASIAAGYKLSTDATEPKNIALIEQYAAPYEIKPSDSPEQARLKMENLERFIVESGVAKGATNPLQDSLRSKPMPQFSTFNQVPGT